MDRSRVARRLATFALIGALGFGSGWAVAQAWPGDSDAPTHEMDPDMDMGVDDTTHGTDHGD
jgi:hypothetical protein